jgi:hypothetical protein
MPPERQGHDPLEVPDPQPGGLSAEMAEQAEAIATGSKVTTDDILAAIHEMRSEREEHLMRLFENRGCEPE